MAPVPLHPGILSCDMGYRLAMEPVPLRPGILFQPLFAKCKHGVSVSQLFIAETNCLRNLTQEIFSLVHNFEGLQSTVTQLWSCGGVKDTMKGIADLMVAGKQREEGAIRLPGHLQGYALVTSLPSHPEILEVDLTRSLIESIEVFGLSWSSHDIYKMMFMR